MMKLLVNPLINSHSVDFGNNVIVTKLDGGASRFRLDKIGSAHTVPVQWVLESAPYNYLMAFYRTIIDYGSLPFTIDLKAVDGFDLGTYTARFIGSLRMTVFMGSLCQVSATLEIVPATRDVEGDVRTVYGYTYGEENLIDWEAEIDNLVNEKLPAIME